MAKLERTLSGSFDRWLARIEVTFAAMKER